MFTLRKAALKRLGVTLAIAGLLSPNALLAQSPNERSTPAREQVKLKVSVTDVALTAGGRMAGQLVDSDGKAVAGAMVKVHQDSKVVGQAVSDRDGMFQVSGLKPGVYSVAGPNAMGIARAWADGSAPPQARNGMVLVNQKEPLVRGQYGFLEPGYVLLLGTSTAGLIVGSVGLSKINDVEDRVVIVPSSP